MFLTASACFSVLDVRGRLHLGPQRRTARTHQGRVKNILTVEASNEIEPYTSLNLVLKMRFEEDS